MSAFSYWGVDVGKDYLDLAHTQGFCQRYTNDDEGIESIKQFLAGVEDLQLVVLEPSGGYEILAMSALLAASLPVARVNPQRVRQYAYALGIKAKTDALDAQVLAQFGQGVKPAVCLLPSDAQLELQFLVKRRADFIDMRKKEKQRVKQPHTRQEHPSFEEALSFARAQIRSLTKEIMHLLQNTPELQTKFELLTSCPGIGKGAAFVLMAQLPELGKIGPKQIAALVGVAPFDQQSGGSRNKSRIRGGRREVRQVLSTATWAATALHNKEIKIFYERLTQKKGKTHRQALTACSRKLLVWLGAMLKSGQKYDPTIYPSYS